jgi:hypothetical protein
MRDSATHRSDDERSPLLGLVVGLPLVLGLWAILGLVAYLCFRLVT